MGWNPGFTNSQLCVFGYALLNLSELPFCHLENRRINVYFVYLVYELTKIISAKHLTHSNIIQ